MTELVRLDQRVDGVAVITLDSPHNRNALSRRLVAELADAVARATADDPRAIVVRHDGPAFCAGADLKEAAATDGPTDARPFIEVLRTLMDVGCPTIAAVAGSVRAGGIGLMASCDLVVVASDVNFALTEVRIGVAPAIIAVPILRRVPPNRIAAAMLTGEPFSADEALAMGLITHVADDVVAVVDHLLAGVLAGAPGAVRETKRLLTTVPQLDRDDAFEQMRALSERLFRGPDAAEGMAAFAAKRTPAWQT